MCVQEETPLIEVLKILSNPAQSEPHKGKGNVRRVGVESEDKRVIGMITQYGLVKYIYEIAKENSLFQDTLISEITKINKEKQLYLVDENEQAREVFRMMVEHRIR